MGTISNKLVADKTTESDVELELYTQSWDVGFSEVDGKYVPTCSMWYVNNQDNTHEGGTYVQSHVNIDLSDKDENAYFVLTADVEMRNTTSNSISP